MSQSSGLSENAASSEGLSTDDSGAKGSSSEEASIYTSSDSEKYDDKKGSRKSSANSSQEAHDLLVEESNLEIIDISGKKNNPKDTDDGWINTETPEFLEASYNQINVNKERKLFTNLPDNVNFNNYSNISGISNLRDTTVADGDIIDPEVKFQLYLKEAKDLRKKVPRVSSSLIEDHEFLIPTAKEDQGMESLDKLADKRRYILFKTNDYYKKAYKQLIIREKMQHVSDKKSVVDREILVEQKAKLYLKIALNMLDIACLEHETEGRGQYIQKFMIYAQRTINTANSLQMAKQKKLHYMIQMNSMRIQEQFEFKVWDKIRRFDEYEVTQKLLERAYRCCPKIEGRPLFFLKLRHFLAKKLFEIYYHLAVIIEGNHQDKEQALNLMKLSLALCKEFNESNPVPKYTLSDRPVLAKLKDLSRNISKDHYKQDLVLALAKFNEARRLINNQKRDQRELCSSVIESLKIVLRLI